MDCREARERFSPYLDDELDAVASHELAQHVASCAECAAELERHRTLGERLRGELEYHRAPDLLRARILQKTRAAAPRAVAPSRTVNRSWGWLTAAAAALTVVGGAWLATNFTRERADQLTASEVVSGHVRSLMASHLTDVTSTDQHTVKPWFAGKLDYSPPVTDYAEAGYPLVGGRLDYLHGRSVAALVYLRHKHTINVYVWPESGERDRFAPATTQQGFHMIHGAHAGMAYWLVSDLNTEELETFAHMLVSPAPAPAPPAQP